VSGCFTDVPAQGVFLISQEVRVSGGPATSNFLSGDLAIFHLSTSAFPEYLAAVLWAGWPGIEELSPRDARIPTVR
jgi:hypothetical protein